MALAALNAQLQRQQRFYQDKFHRYRNGLPRSDVDFGTIIAQINARDVAAAAHLAGLLALPLPGLGNFQFTQGHRDRLRAIAARRRRPLQGLGPPPLRRLGRDSREAIKDQLNNVRALLGPTFRFVKCLGWGGGGVITLWRYKPPRGQEHGVVMKQPASVSLGPGGGLTLDTDGIFAEKNMMSVRTDFKEPFPVSLAHRCLPDAMSGTSHRTPVPHEGSPSRGPCGPR